MTIDVGQGLLNAGLFMGIPLILLIFAAMWKWERMCRKNIKVLEIKEGGGSEVFYVLKQGGEVSIINKEMGVTRTWPINQLATIPMPYPELGILPRFLQREIQTVILHEGDWEPVLNRSPHRDNVASPNVVKLLLDLKGQITETDTPRPTDADTLRRLEGVLEHVTTGPTREMIASPAILGAIKASSVMKALATVGDDLMDMLKGLRAQLMRVAGLNPTYVYILLLLNLALLGFVLYQVMQGGSNDPALMEEINRIRAALGIQAPVPTVPVP